MIPVLVPWRPADQHRQRIWSHLQTRYWPSLPGYRIVQGDSPAGPFNRSAAVNQAARKAGDWDVAVIADADAFVPPHQLHQAVTTAHKTGRLTAAFHKVIELGPDCTEHILATGQIVWEHLDIDRIRTEQKPLTVQSLMLAVPKSLFNLVDGFDEAFQGYGGDDNAFWKACTVFGGEPERIHGNAFHLWHQPAEYGRKDQNYMANQKRWRQYAVARAPRHIKALRDA